MPEHCLSSCIFSPLGSVCLVQLLEDDVLVKLLPVPWHHRELQGHSEPPASWSAAENTILVSRLLGQCYLPGIWYQMALPVPARSHTVLGSYWLVLRGVKFSLCLINGLLMLKDQWGKCGNIHWYSCCVLAREIINLIGKLNPKICHGKYLKYRCQTR